MNNTCEYALVIGGKVYVAWKRKMLHDVIGGHQAYIQRNKDLFIYGTSNFAAGEDHARDEITKSLRSELFGGGGDKSSSHLEV